MTVAPSIQPSKPVTPATPAVVSESPAPTPRPLKVAARRVPTPTKRPPAMPATGLILDRARDSLRAGDLVAAERAAEDVLPEGNSGQKSVAHFILGKVLLFRGQKKAAAGEFAQAIELDPDNVAAADELATLRRRGSP